ncbi:Patatin-like phospholipase domain-containing protein [Drosera capensis]
MMFALPSSTAKTDLFPSLPNRTMKLPITLFKPTTTTIIAATAATTASSHLRRRRRSISSIPLHYHSTSRLTHSLITKFSSSNPNDTADDDDGGGGDGIGVSDGGTEKKSFAVATGELFLGIAARLIRRREKKVGEGERIGGVEEEEEEGVVWEQREKDVEAKKRRAVRSPGFSFSAAGLLFPYHLGVAELLIEKGYIMDSTPLAGSSAGAIVCAVIASGSSMQEALDVTKVLAQDCRLRGTAFRLGAVLRDVLTKFLPDDVHIRSSGRVRVAVTQILWRPRGVLIDQFDSKDDLIDAVFTSSFIPGYLAPRPATMFRNRLCIDGGLTLFMPPTSAAQTVRVCAFPASQLGLQGIGISPDCNPENRPGPRQLFNMALEPTEDDQLDELFEFGYRDAAVWAEQNPLEEIVHENGSEYENGRMA